MIVPMVRTVENVKEQDPLWEWLLNTVKSARGPVGRGEDGTGRDVGEQRGARDKARACYKE